MTIERQLVNGQPHSIDKGRDLEYYRRLVQLVIALCSLVYEWRTGEKPPKLRDVL